MFEENIAQFNLGTILGNDQFEAQYCTCPDDGDYVQFVNKRTGEVLCGLSTNTLWQLGKWTQDLQEQYS